ncbi:MAG: dihydroorotate dehydrogenase electron transfer subunit [Clostridia bacterium]|nr:dihydroorotate dehydrogenase electron transfer subunit [Clostridia bacterium]
MKFTIKEQRQLTSTVYFMRLEGDTTGISKTGQFVQIQLPGFYLRRPISINDWVSGENGTLDLIYKVVGHGTEAMKLLPDGTELDLLIGLGNGYNIDGNEEKPLLIGGGVGVPPLYALCKALIAQGKKPAVVLGFNTASEVFWKDEFEALGVSVTVTTVDGSMGVKGFVTNAMDGDFDYVYTCGPEPMFKAVYKVLDEKGLSGQFSFEERMACGFGVCMGCSCKTKYGNKRICKDGPVLVKEEIIW